MLIGVVSDIHSNLDAFSAVLEELDTQNVSTILCAGDIVGYGANPNECIELASDHVSFSVTGNHDLAVLNSSNTEFFNRNAKEACNWTRKKLEPFSFGYLSNLPLSLHLDDLNIYLAHSEISFPAFFDYVQTSYEASYNFYTMNEGSICFVGHSHVPIIFYQNEKILFNDTCTFSIPDGSKAIVNVGSVGQPRDGNSQSCYAVYDTEKREVTLHRLSYNIRQASEKIRKAGLPRVLADRLKYGR